MKATEQKLVIYQGTLIRLSAISVCVLKTDTSHTVMPNINDTRKHTPLMDREKSEYLLNDSTTYEIHAYF